MTNDTTGLLRKRLDLAEGLFRQCEHLAKDLGGVDFAPLALFRHIMQMGDGIFILAKAMSSHPMVPLLRSMLECFFSLEYILCKGKGESKDLEEHSKRSLSWLVFCINQEIALKEMIDLTTSRGQAFKSELREHSGSVATELCSHLERKSGTYYSAQPLRDRLAEPDLVNLQEEYQKLKSKPGYFFQLVDPKIRRIEDLAREIGRWERYKIFYKRFSHTVHGTAPLKLLEHKREGAVRFGELRTTAEQAFLVGLAEAVLHGAGDTLVKHYRTQAEAFPG